MNRFLKSEKEEYSVFTEEEMKNYQLPDDGEWEEC